MKSMHQQIVERLASMPLSTEDTHATWTPPDWEQVIEWWDQFVTEARVLTGRTYRGNTKGEKQP